MAVTKGHGNPKWGRDETILALDLYFQMGTASDEGDKRITELSAFLRSLPYHRSTGKNAQFRNPAGVAFKLQNLHAVRTGRGLRNVSRTDRAVWQEFGTDPERVRRLANLIREGAKESEPLEDFELDDELPEGQSITQMHRRRERNRKVRKSLLASRRRKGPLSCDMCSYAPKTSNAKIVDAAFEAHHLLPLAMSGARTTKLSDLALLCANCHRLLHRAIALERRWLTVAEARPICLA